MNKLMAIGIAVCLCSIVFAQSAGRISSTLPNVSVPIATLDAGTGWVKDSFDEWHGNTKLLSPAPSNNRDLGISDFHRSKFDDYGAIHLREVSIKSNQYFSLEKKHLMGKFAYPAIRKDWYTYSVTDVCVFEKLELNQLAQAIEEQGVARRVTLECVYGPIIENADFAEEPIERLIARRVAFEERDARDFTDIYRIHFDVFPVNYKGRRLIRFLWRESGYAVSNVPFSRRIFDSRYYEVDWDVFAKLAHP